MRAPLFLPYLSGERTPHNNPHAQGVFFGLTHEHDAAARLAWLADGGAVDAVCRAPEVAATFAPRHARFRALYRAVEGLFPMDGGRLTPQAPSRHPPLGEEENRVEVLFFWGINPSYSL